MIKGRDHESPKPIVTNEPTKSLVGWKKLGVEVVQPEGRIKEVILTGDK
jgi:hypothetical protein